MARAHPDLQPAIDSLIHDMQATPARRFVHGDYSPKNMLIDPQGQLMLLDFECAHAGDPAFDLGFFLTHLFLKGLPRQVPGPACRRRPTLSRPGPSFLDTLHGRARPSPGPTLAPTARPATWPPASWPASTARVPSSIATSSTRTRPVSSPGKCFSARLPNRAWAAASKNAGVWLA